MPNKKDDEVLGAELDFAILAGRNLTPMDGTGMFKMGKLTTSDPYVRLSLALATREIKRETAVVSKTVNPEWSNAAYKFHLNQKDWNQHTSGSTEIVLSIFDRDRGVLDADDPMGEVRVPLKSLQQGQMVDKWYPVQPCPGCAKPTGENTT